MLNVSASIVAYGGYEEVAAAAQSLLTCTKGAQLTLFLIDNASPDGTGERLEQAFGTQCRVLRLPQNVGFGKGHNACLAELTSDVHFIVNPDIVVHSDVLTGMARYLHENPHVALATPALCFPDGQVQYTPKRIPNFMGLLARQLPGKMLDKYDRHYTMQDEDLTVAQDVQFCSGCFMAVRTSALQKVGGFDTAYFMYVEDADLTRKLLGEGRAVYLPQFTVTHAWHRDARRKMKNFIWQINSMLRYWRKWGFRWK